jgi:hypothetical protein
MNNAVTRSLIAAAELERIAADLHAACEDVALLERLKSAKDRVTRLTAEQEKVTKERDRALAAEAKAADAARFAGISDVSVTDGSPNENVLRSDFTITYTKPYWDGRETRQKQQSATSFGSLPADVLAYLMDKRPDLIPAKIMALAPDDPKAAFGCYFVSLKRGHVAG